MLRLESLLREDIRGATLVEFAFAFPILVLFSLGILDFSRIMTSYIDFADSLRRAGRAAVVSGEECQTHVQEEMENFLNTRLWGIAVQGEIECQKEVLPTDESVCTITAKGNILCLFCSRWFGGSSEQLSFTSSVVVPVEHPDACQSSSEEG